MSIKQYGLQEKEQLAKTTAGGNSLRADAHSDAEKTAGDGRIRAH
jgi:hypothetical protein